MFGCAQTSANGNILVKVVAGFPSIDGGRSEPKLAQSYTPVHRNKSRQPCIKEIPGGSRLSPRFSCNLPMAGVHVADEAVVGGPTSRSQPSAQLLMASMKCNMGPTGKDLKRTTSEERLPLAIVGIRGRWAALPGRRSSSLMPLMHQRSRRGSTTLQNHGVLYDTGGI
ncbi:hypothetical protein MGG_15014 [Pyricularia oryzae 70-15]|uniref:Uncharacterized protein n=3 Tax=Pyricularia oryzae TaxID=318829 RepID=G4NJ95_PYRO7|nr:uncharacterized protein MGG_15014 [Pyricularia oryzae 70-15]EHA46311.1 hypothetical protein MGG_15014 [Pyricularia oryzae 70-15]ELQ36220.1 hypothetical protein OOU_Y34scaffold00666g81 [Pyricularia oryzae Y34]